MAFGIDIEQIRKGSSIQYVRDLKEQLASAYRKASENMKKNSDRNKTHYDSSAHAAELE